METSDSECFESADEDFVSDDEATQTVISDVKKEETEKQEKNVKSVTKVDNVNVDKNKNSSQKQLSQETIENKNFTGKQEDVKVESKSDEIEDIKSDEEKISEDNLKNKNFIKEDKKSETIEKHANKDNKTISEPKPKPSKIKLGSKITNDKTSKNAPKEVPKEIPVCSKEEIPNPSPSTENKSITTATSKQIPVVNEENLWNDEEIDWGKEEELEIQQKKLEPSKSNDEPNMWEDDDWEPVENIKPQPKSESKPVQSDSGWGGWGNWGVSSILNTATQSVSTLTNHVTQGLNTVLESGIGVPDPEELARQHKQDEEELIKNIKEMDVKDECTDHGGSLGGFGFGNLVSGVSHLTKLVETTGTKVISGGLDTLETIGKKTMEVLQEGDPGLKKKRAFLKLDPKKPILSQVLREAKEKADEENKQLEQKHFQKKAKNYETLFDDHQGLVHLEALEMLSKQCDIKLETLNEKCSGDAATEMQETLDQVKELCELPEEDEDEQLSFAEIQEKIETAVSEIGIPISYNKLMSTFTDTENWLENLKIEVVDEHELHQQAIETLAQMTAISVEQFHKAGELLLVKEHRSTADEADSLVQLTSSQILLIGIVAAKFSEKLNGKAESVNNKESVNELITNIFFESSNSSSYIQDAFQLLIPVLQVGAV